METIREGKRAIKEAWDRGEAIPCPCCGKKANLWRYKPHSTQVASLIKLYKMGGGFHHYTKFWLGTKSCDFSVLKWWGLIESAGDKPDEKNSSGDWMITQDGVWFVRGMTKLSVPANVFNNKLIGYGLEEKSVTQCLGKKFDYDELMRESIT